MRFPEGVLFRCDAGPQIGGGHLMRCLTLANALSEAGADVTFAAAEMPDILETSIRDAGYRFQRIPPSPELQRDRARWEEPPLSAEAQQADASATQAIGGSADWLIVDHYLLDAHWHSVSRAFSGQILVIDDLANRPCDCDILLDQTLGRSAADYRNFVSKKTRMLTGPTYALLRPEFARERSASLERRKKGEPARRILVSMGSGDPGGVTAEIVDQLIVETADCTIDVVMGPQSNSLGDLRTLAESNSRIHLHVNSNRMAELMRDADLAIGAAGMTSWERCCLGLPSIVVVLGENQRAGAEALDAAGAALMLDNPEKIGAAVRSLIASLATRMRMAESGAQITDGLGSMRVHAAMDSMTCGEKLHD